MTGVDPKGLQTFALRQIGEIELDGPEGHETITGVILEGDAAAVRSVGALFGERVSVVAALTPLKGAPAGYLFELCYSHAHDRWSGTMYGETLPNPEDVRNVRPLAFAYQPLPEEKAK